MEHDAVRVYAILLVAVVVALAGVLIGAWWAPFLVGLAAGIAEPRARIAIPVGAVSGLLAWALPLGALEVRFGLGPTAASIAAIMGFGHQGAIPLVLSSVVGLLLGLTGAWLATAARTLIASPAR